MPDDNEASSDEYDEADSLCNEMTQEAVDSQFNSNDFSLQAVLNNQDNRDDNEKDYQEKEAYDRGQSTTNNSVISSDYHGKTFLSSTDQRKGRQ